MKLVYLSALTVLLSGAAAQQINSFDIRITSDFHMNAGGRLLLNSSIGSMIPLVKETAIHYPLLQPGDSTCLEKTPSEKNNICPLFYVRSFPCIRPIVCRLHPNVCDHCEHPVFVQVRRGKLRVVPSKKHKQKINVIRSVSPYLVAAE